MAPIPIKDIVKISSESETFPASNLLTDKKWLTCPKDKVSKNVIEFSFQSPAQIRYIDIGYFNVASLEVYVGSSDWSPSEIYAQLIPAVTLQSALDAKAGNSKTGCKMLNFHEHMCKEIGEKKWDRVKLVLFQPYARNKQMGLEFVRFGTQKNHSTEKESTNQSDVLSPASLKPESSFFKMMNRIKSSGDDRLLNTTGKLNQLSDPGNPFGRNAKMLMASKSLTPQASYGNGNLKQHCTKQLQNESSQKPNKPRRLFEADSKSAKSQTTSDDQELQRANMPSAIVRKNSQHKLKTPHQKTQSTIKSNHSEKVDTKKSVFTNQADFLKMNTNQNQHNPKPKQTRKDKNEDTRDHLYKKENDCIMDESSITTEPRYSEQQAKKLKKAINDFFKSIDKDDLDLANIKIKDLRRQFESVNNVRLNREGRQHFRNVTAENVHLIHLHQQHNRKPTKRKSSEISEDNLPECSIQSSTSSYSESPNKIFRPNVAASSSVHKVQCPLCSRMFDGSVIESHAAVCGEDVIEETQNYQQLPMTNRDSFSTVQPGTVVDCSENSCLTPEQQLNWIQFSKEPKPYQDRLNRSAFEGCKLVKCPSCGQKYKIEDIQQHSDDCAEKVNSKYTKVGLYYVKNDTKEKKKKPQGRSYSSDIKVVDGMVVID